MKDDSKRISVAVTDTYAIMSYHMENGTINISTGDEGLVRVYVSLSLENQELYSLVEQFINHIANNKK